MVVVNRVSRVVLLLMCLVISTLVFSAPAVAQMDHSQHEMGNHQMSPEMLKVMRERIPKYQESTDQQIALEMQMMGPNQMRYLSDPSLHAETGLLVLIHGFGETGDRIMTEAVAPMAKIFPTAMAGGMSMMGSDHIQKALDAITKAGAKTIVVVPMASSTDNTLIYQWQYIFGLREHGGFYDVPRVKTDAKIIMADPPAGHPMITRIILDHAKEISKDPANEVLFVIAHGPVHEKENRMQLERMEKQARQIKELGGFSKVVPVTLQDDAKRAVRAKNVENLRHMIEQAQADGKRVLIVTDLLAARSIQWKIDRDLDGLDYEFSVKGISQHPDFVRWFREDVMDALSR